MGQKTDIYLANLEASIKEDLEKEIGINKISELKNFSFQNFEEFRKAYHDNKISLASDYSYDKLMIYATKSEIVMHHIWIGLPILIIIFNILFAIFSKNWIILFGCLTALLGNLTSSPHFKPRNTLTSISIIAFIAFIFIEWKIALIIGSFTLSIMFTMLARETYKQVIIDRAMYSETLFIWLFVGGTLLVRDNTK